MVFMVYVRVQVISRKINDALNRSLIDQTTKKNHFLTKQIWPAVLC